MCIERIGRILSAVILLGALQSCTGSDSTPEVLTPTPAPASTVATTMLTLRDGTQVEVAADQLEVYFMNSATNLQKQAVATFLQGSGATILRDFPDANTTRFQVTTTDLKGLLDADGQLPGVLSASPLVIVVAEADPLPPRFSTTGCVRLFPFPACDTWINVIAARQAWDVVTGSSSQLVGVVDSDIVSNLKGTKPIAFVPTTGYSNPSPLAGHGTIVSGITAADGRDNAGMAGAAWQNPVLVANLSQRPCPTPINPNRMCLTGYPSDAIRAVIEQAPVLGLQLVTVNISAGASTPTRGAFEEFRFNLRHAVSLARDRQILLVVAAGNDPVKNDSRWLPPLIAGASPEKIAEYNALIADYHNHMLIVGGLDTSRKRAEFYTEGDIVELYAPSVNVGSIINQVCGRASYNMFINCGTSFAAPQVTGVAALVAAVNPTFTAPQIKERLLDSACQVGDTKILNASRAVNPPIDPQSGATLPYTRWDLASVVFNGAGQDVVIKNLVTGGTVTVGSGNSPAWSPDGRKLAFHRTNTAGVTEIYTFDTMTSIVATIATGSSPAWSPCFATVP